MSRAVTLFTGQWADLPFETICQKAKSFGYDGIELATWGDHFEVDKALKDKGYCKQRWEVLKDNGSSASRSPPTSSARPSATTSTSGTSPSSRPRSGATASPRASASAPRPA